MAFISAVPAVARRSFVPSSSNSPLCQSRQLRGTQRRSYSHAPARMLVVEVKTTVEMDTVLENAGESLVVVDYSTTWCGPCKVIAPVFEELSNRFTDVIFVKVMGDATPEAGDLMKRENIRAVPAFHFWKGGERVLQFTGAKATAIEEGIVKFM